MSILNSNDEQGDKTEELKKIIQDLPEIEQQTVNILHRIQAERGYIPQPYLQSLADITGIPESTQQGLISFFDSFRTRPTGKHCLSVCYGTACYARGAHLIYDRLCNDLDLDLDGNSPDGFITVEKVFCVGACSQAPVIAQGDKINGKIKSHQVPFLIKELRNKG